MWGWQLWSAGSFWNWRKHSEIPRSFSVFVYLKFRVCDKITTPNAFSELPQNHSGHWSSLQWCWVLEPEAIGRNPGTRVNTTAHKWASSLHNMVEYGRIGLNTSKKWLVVWNIKCYDFPIILGMSKNPKWLSLHHFSRWLIIAAPRRLLGQLESGWSTRTFRWKHKLRKCRGWRNTRPPGKVEILGFGDLPGLVLTNSLRTWKWPTEIVDLPIEHGDFPYLC